MSSSLFVACRLTFLALLFLPMAARAQAQAAEAPPLTAADRRAAVERIAELLEERYVFPDVGAEAGHLLMRQLDAGAYEALSDDSVFAERLTADLQAVAHDKHLNVWLSPSGAEADDAEALAVAYQRHERETNYGFASVERLEGNVGYLDLRGFLPPGTAEPTALAALRLLHGSDAVVVDLRKNNGGSPEMVRLLLSHFFPKRTHLNSLYYRHTDTTTEFWTLDDPPGPIMGDIPLFVLTSDRTFSAGEEFVYDLQTRQRATIVGDTTGGGANPGGAFPVHGRLEVFIPMGRAINPVTGTNWEGTGVVPHVAVPAEEAYERGVALARKAAETYRTARYAAEDALRVEVREDMEAAERRMAAGQPEAGEALASALWRGLEADLFNEGGLNMIGYDYLRGGRTALAVATFEVNAEAFPDSWNAHDSLGEAYAAAGRTGEAIAAYERSLALNPSNTGAEQALRRLRGGESH